MSSPVGFCLKCIAKAIPFAEHNFASFDSQSKNTIYNVPYFWRNLIQPSNRHYKPSNQHVIQQALQQLRLRFQILTCERAYSLRVVWPAEEVGSVRKISPLNHRIKTALFSFQNKK
jgi:hypothetical protein